VIALATVLGLGALAAGCGARDPATPATGRTPPAAGTTSPAVARSGDGRLDCRGRGEPVVVLESGLGVDPATTWAGVKPDIARRTRVCSVLRPGLGGVTREVPPRTAGQAADSLARLLDAGAPGARVVLVGASFGGLIAQIYAGRHRDRVAGIVLVDSIHPDLDATFARLFGPIAAAKRALALAQNTEGVDFADLLVSDREARAVRSLGDVPLVALAHSDSFNAGESGSPRLERAWRRMQARLAALSTRGEMRIPAHSHHRIAEDRPDAVVAAIEQVLGEAPGAG
jgi:pimeloyl-ACP methyl ester carboxylesterase